MTTTDTWTVARYLATRLQQLGISHLFGVPGDYLGPFLSVITAAAVCDLDRRVVTMESTTA
jgi:TPP-dependent 2-oxoacid decarboxylase